MAQYGALVNHTGSLRASTAGQGQQYGSSASMVPSPQYPQTGDSSLAFSQGTNFFNLPREVRDLIYEDAAAQEETLVLVLDREGTPVWPVPSLLQAHPRTREEYPGLLLKHVRRLRVRVSISELGDLSRSLRAALREQYEALTKNRYGLSVALLPDSLKDKERLMASLRTWVAERGSTAKEKLSAVRYLVADPSGFQRFNNVMEQSLALTRRLKRVVASKELVAETRDELKATLPAEAVAEADEIESAFKRHIDEIDASLEDLHHNSRDHED